MASLITCGNPSPGTGLIIPAAIAPVGGITLAGVLGGTQQLLPAAIPFGLPLFDSPSPSGGTITLKIGTGLTLDSNGALTTAGASSPLAHSSTHSPLGSDPIDQSAWDGLIVPPIATDSVLGGVKDGAGVTIAGDGTLSLSPAPNGGIILSPSGVAINPGTGLSLTANALTLDPATASVLGGVIAQTGVAVDGSGNLTLDVASVTGASQDGSYLVWDTSPSAGSPLAGLRIPDTYEYTKVIPASQLPTAAYGSPLEPDPSPQLGMVRVVGPNAGLTLIDGLLSLLTPVLATNLTKATASGGQGIVKLDFLGTHGLTITDPNGSLAIMPSTWQDTIDMDIGGVFVKPDRFLPMGGTGASPSPPAGGYGHMRGLVQWEDDLSGARAIHAGNNRIRMVKSPSAYLADATSDDMLNYGEVAELVTQASLGAGGVLITLDAPFAGEPGTSESGLSNLSAGDRYLTSLDSTINPTGDWAGHLCEIATWTETAPGVFNWVYTVPTKTTLYTEADFGGTWAVQITGSPASPGSPARAAVHFKTLIDTVATTARPGVVRVPTNSGLTLDGPTLRLTMGADVGVTTGLKLTTLAGVNVLALDLSATQGMLAYDSLGGLALAADSITGTVIQQNTISLVNLLADQVPSGTEDFITTQYDGLTVKLVGDTAGFRTTGTAVSTATTILIHTIEGIGIAEESINTDALSDEAITYSKLQVSTSSGIEPNNLDKIQVALQDSSGLLRETTGIRVNIHDSNDDATLTLDASTDGLRLKLASITSDHFAPGLAVLPSQILLSAPMIAASPEGGLSLCYASPLVLSGSPGCLTIGTGAITSPYLGAGSVSFDKLKLASPSGLLSIGGAIQLDISTGFAFSGNQLVVSGIPATALLLHSPGALFESDPDSPGGLASLALAISSPFTQAAGSLDLADGGTYLNHLSRWQIANGAEVSGLEQGALELTSPAPSWAVSPGFLGLSTIGTRVATRTRVDHDYMEPEGQGKGTIEPYGLTLAMAGGTASGSDYQNRLVPTLNSIGLQHLALGNNALAPTDTDRLPTGLGSYKALVLSGKLSSSPALARGWSPANLTDDIVAVRVGPGLTITGAGLVVPDAVGASQLSIGVVTVETSPRGYSGAPLIATSSPTDSLSLAYDVADFEASTALGLGRRLTHRQEFTGATIPTEASGAYAFSLTLGGGSHGLVAGTIDVHINGLRLESSFITYSSPLDTTKIVSLSRNTSPGPNLTYDLVQSTGADTLDRVIIDYRTRPVI